MKKKNILFIFPPKEKGGADYYFRTRHMMDLLRKHYRIETLNFLGDNKTFFEKLSQFILKFPQTVSNIRKCDIAIIYPSALMYLFIPLSKFFQKVIVFDHYTTSVYNFEVTGNFFKYFFKIFDKFVYKKIDQVITHTCTMKNMITNFYRIPSEQVSVIYSCVDTNIFRPIKKPADLMEKYGLKKNQKVILYSGLFHPFHGVDTLLEASKLLQKKNYVFLIVGRKLSRNSKSIISVKTTPYSKLNKHLNLADIWVGTVGVGSQGARALSSNMVSAMACGKPVIVGDWKENNLFIKNNINGFIIRRNDPKLLADKIEEAFIKHNLNEIGVRARQTILKNNSLRVMKFKLNNIFVNL